MDLMKKSLPDQAVYDLLATQVKRRYCELLRFTNVEIVTLFWQIGSILNEYAGETKSKDCVVDLKKTVNLLRDNYRQYFSLSHIKKFRLLAEMFNDSELLQKFSTLATWDQISMLLGLNDKAAFIFYTEQLLINQWNLETLKKHITSKLLDKRAFQQPNSFSTLKKKINHSYKSFDALSKAPIKNYFKKPFSNSFWRLISSEDKPALDLQV